MKNSAEQEHSYEELYAMAEEIIKSPNLIKNENSSIQGTIVTSRSSFKALFTICRQLLPNIKSSYTDEFIDFNVDHESQHLAKAYSIFGDEGRYFYGLATIGTADDIVYLHPFYHYETNQAATVSQQIDILKAPDDLSRGDFMELNKLYQIGSAAANKQAIIDTFIANRIPSAVFETGDNHHIGKRLISSAIVNTDIDSHRAWLEEMRAVLPESEFPFDIETIMFNHRSYQEKTQGNNPRGLVVYGLGYAEKNTSQDNTLIPFTFDITRVLSE
ncbi:hypothetical protein BH09PAT2_BH09PAT2_05280 [soil metagenome]